RIIDDAAGDFLTCRTNDRHHVTVIEFVLDARDPSVQKAGILFGDGVERSLIDVYPSGDTRSKRNPAPFARERFRFSDEQRSVALTRENAFKHAHAGSVGNDRHASGVYRDARGLQLGGHAATAFGRFSGSQRFDFSSDLVYFGYPAGFRIGVWIIRKQA